MKRNALHRMILNGKVYVPFTESPEEILENAEEFLREDAQLKLRHLQQYRFWKQMAKFDATDVFPRENLPGELAPGQLLTVEQTVLTKESDILMDLSVSWTAIILTLLKLYYTYGMIMVRQSYPYPPIPIPPI